MNSLLLRRWHNYLGAFIAPSILFFAFTGALQLFSLHEAHDGYQPAPVIEKLAQLHKNQVFALKHHGPPPDQAPASASSGPTTPHDDGQPAIRTYVLKWFFVLVALELIVSTVFGVCIGLSRPRGKKTTIALIAAGCVLPLAILLA